MPDELAQPTPPPAPRAPAGPPAAQPAARYQPPPMRRFGDYDATRKAVFANALEAARGLPAVENSRYALTVHDVGFHGPDAASYADHKRALYEGRTLGRRLVGTLRLTDKASGAVVDARKLTLASVPVLTSQGVFVLDGTASPLCLYAHARVWTESGMRRIRDIVESRSAVRVWSYDFDSEQFVLRRVVAWHKNQLREKIGTVKRPAYGMTNCRLPGFKSTTLHATPGHEVYRADGTKAQLGVAEKITVLRERLSAAQTQIIYGSLLGDGNITNGTYTESHAVEQAAWLDMKRRALGDLIRADGLRPYVNNATGRNYVKTTTVRHAELIEAEALCYPDGKKRVSQAWLDKLDARGLACWFGDDGSCWRRKNNNSISLLLSTQSFSTTCVDLLLTWLRDKWAVAAYKSRIAKYKDKDWGWEIRVTGRDADNFLDIVAPYMTPDMRYKMPLPPVVASCASCQTEVVKARKYCDRCALAQFATGKERSYARARFGGTAAVRQILRTRVYPAEYRPADQCRVRDGLFGSRVSEMLSEPETKLSLAEVDFTYEFGVNCLVDAAKYGYDIEVEDTHNYFADGVLVSNSHQMRLAPGSYVRKKSNSLLEAHLPFLPGEGVPHRFFLDPESGQIKTQVGQAELPAHTLMKALGATDEEIAAAWGPELAADNAKASRPHHLEKYWEKMGPGGKQRPADLAGALRQHLETFKFDPWVTARTLGAPLERYGKDAALRATGKLVKVARGEAEPDDRDNPAYSVVWGPEHLIAERITRSRPLLAKALWQATNKGSLKGVQPGLLTPGIRALFSKSGLGQSVEGTNNAEFLDHGARITKVGEGGIGRSADSVPASARNVNPGQFLFIDPIRASESENIGVDLRVAFGTRLGADRQMYAPVLDPKTNRILYRSPRDLADATVAFPGWKNADTPLVPAIQKGKMTWVKPEELDYAAPSMEQSFSPLTNLVPIKSASKPHRASMGARYIVQALPLDRPEAPLVRTQVPNQPGKSFEELFGRHMGAVISDKPGVVSKLTPDGITVTHGDGTTTEHPLYNWLPSGRKTGVNHFPLVQQGQQVGPGHVLARSGFTDQNGHAAYGANLRTAFASMGGHVYEDSVLVSQSAANRLSSSHLYQHHLPLDEHTKTGVDMYLSAFPGKYPLATFKNFDPDGVIRPGTKVESGHPLVLGVRKRLGEFGRLSKSGKAGLTDASQTWDHEEPGVVTDVSRTPQGIKVSVHSVKPLKDGDKVSGRHGNKGVVVIRPDHRMPTDAQGRPVDVILSSLGTISRANPSAIFEAHLGKIAEKTGKPYVVDDFHDNQNVANFVDGEAKKHNVPFMETLTDPDTGRPIPNVGVGNLYLMKLLHISESKAKGRGLGGYDESGQPLRGQSGKAMRASLGDTHALLSHGATDVLRDLHLYKGQANDVFWQAYMNGYPPPRPTSSKAFDRFLSELKASGVHPVRDGDRLHLTALRDQDVHELAGDREVKNGETLDFNRNGAPVPGGLFDLATTGGPEGNMWGKITLHEPVPNPVAEEPIRRLLGLTREKFRGVLSGRETILDQGGPKAVLDALKKIDVDAELKRTEKEARSSRKTLRDDANRKLTYLRTLKAQGRTPADWFLSAVPVLPPVFRPIRTSSFCFHAKTGVWTEDGMVPIGTIVREKRNCRVWTYDFATKSLSLQPIVGWHRNKVPGLRGYKVPTPRGRLAASVGVLRPEALWVTPGHQVFQADGRTVSVGSAASLLAARESFSETQKQMLYGTLLGDGHVSPAGSYYAGQGADQIEYARLKADIFSPLVRGGLKSRPYVTPAGDKRTGAGFSTLVHAELLAARALCYTGPDQKKEVTTSWLDKVGDLGLAFWFFDDGESYYEGSVPVVKFSTQCFSRAGVDLLVGWLANRWGLRAALMRWNAQYKDRDLGWQLVIRGDDARSLMALVAPYATNDVAYKILGAAPATTCKTCGTRLPVRLHLSRTCGSCVGRLAKTAATSNLRRSRRQNTTDHAAEQAAVDSAVVTARESIGSRLPALRTDTRLSVGLEEVPVLGAATNLAFEATQTGYDITVAGNHNYFADGYLVSNSGKNNVIISDPNLLYKDVIETNKALKMLSGQVGDLGDERLAAYDAVKAVMGLGEPVSAKNKERGVKGILEKLLGSSSKFSYLQQKLLGTPADLSGRGQILPDPDLHMDEIGVPESVAWEVYHPFVVRRLVQAGMPRAEAARMVEARGDAARRALVEEMGARPVTATRYPALHRYSVMAFRPRLAAGDAIRLTPIVTKGYGADFDGDTMTLHVPLTDDAVEEAYEKMLPSKNLYSVSDFKPRNYLPNMEFVQGLHAASVGDAGNAPVEFRTRKEALAALKAGKVGFDTRVRILED